MSNLWNGLTWATAWGLTYKNGEIKRAIEGGVKNTYKIK